MPGNEAAALQLIEAVSPEVNAAQREYLHPKHFYLNLRSAAFTMLLQLGASCKVFIHDEIASLDPNAAAINYSPLKH